MVLSNITVSGVATYVFNLVAPGSASAQGVVVSGLAGLAAVNNCTRPFTLDDDGGNVGWLGSVGCFPQEAAGP